MIVNGECCTSQWKAGRSLTILYDYHSLLPRAHGYHNAEALQLVGTVNLCVSDDANCNLSWTQKELLKWHFHPGHMNMSLIQ